MFVSNTLKNRLGGRADSTGGAESPEFWDVPKQRANLFGLLRFWDVPKQRANLFGFTTF
jgi:hypothetical protein